MRSPRAGLGTVVAVGNRRGCTSGQAKNANSGMMTQHAKSSNTGSHRGIKFSCVYKGFNVVDWVSPVTVIVIFIRLGCPTQLRFLGRKWSTFSRLC